MKTARYLGDCALSLEWSAPRPDGAPPPPSDRDRIYALTEPVPWCDARTLVEGRASFVVVSARLWHSESVGVHTTQERTSVYAATEAGVLLSWRPLFVHVGGFDHAIALRGLGFEVAS